MTGAVYGVRRELYRNIPPETLLDDLYCPLQVYLQDKRVLFCREAKAYDTVSENVGEEWRRKVRTLAGNWQLFSLIKEVRNPCKFGLWWKFYSHKISRLIVPFLLPVVFICSSLMDNLFYTALFWLQVVFYGCALSAMLFKRLQKNRLISLCYFFCVLNAAALVGFYHWIRGDLTKCWK